MPLLNKWRVTSAFSLNKDHRAKWGQQRLYSISYVATQSQLPALMGIIWMENLCKHFNALLPSLPPLPLLLFSVNMCVCVCIMHVFILKSLGKIPLLLHQGWITMRSAMRRNCFVAQLVALDVQLSRPLNLLRRNSMSEQNKRQQDSYVRANEDPQGMRKSQRREKRREKRRDKERI